MLSGFFEDTDIEEVDDAIRILNIKVMSWIWQKKYNPTLQTLFLVLIRKKWFFLLFFSLSFTRDLMSHEANT